MGHSETDGLAIGLKSSSDGRCAAAQNDLAALFLSLSTMPRPRPALSAAMHSEAYLNAYRERLRRARAQRDAYRALLARHLEQTSGKEALWETPLRLSQIPEVALLLSSSRGGSSVVSDVLRQQAVDIAGSRGKLLSVPGEHKPHLVLAGLQFPILGRLSEELAPADALADDPLAAVSAAKLDYLQKELLCEIGHPLKETSDLSGFAIDIFGRLLLQWPDIDFGEAQAAVEKISQELSELSGACGTAGFYRDEERYRRKLIPGLARLFPQIRTEYYDGISVSPGPADASAGPPSLFAIEEPPFIVPAPWHHATLFELQNGVLFLKDPSDAWRIDFWKTVFSNSLVHLIHLARDPRSVINGLCDGWRYSYGYYTILSPKPLPILGYADEGGWRQYYVNYSTFELIWDVLAQQQKVRLEAICALQWAGAHQAILEHERSPHYWLIAPFSAKIRGFEWILKRPVDTYAIICNQLGVHSTPSLIIAAASMPNRKVQVIPGVPIGRERWQDADNYKLIAEAADAAYVKEVARRLGYCY